MDCYNETANPKRQGHTQRAEQVDETTEIGHAKGAPPSVDVKTIIETGAVLLIEGLNQAMPELDKRWPDLGYVWPCLVVVWRLIQEHKNANGTSPWWKNWALVRALLWCTLPALWHWYNG